MYWEHMEKAYFIGRVTRDLKLTYLNSGMAKGEFGIAVQKSIKKGDSYEKKVSFYNIETWGKDAEGLQHEIKKGVLVHVCAEIENNTWEKDGKSYNKIIFKAERVLTKDVSHRQSMKEEFDDFKDDIPF